MTFVLGRRLLVLTEFYVVPVVVSRVIGPILHLELDLQLALLIVDMGGLDQRDVIVDALALAGELPLRAHDQAELLQVTDATITGGDGDAILV
jgi:hypothetical protein